MRGWTLILTIFLVINVVVDAASLSSWLSPKYLDKILAVASPFFKNPEDAKAIDNLNSIRETISRSAIENEGWTDLSKRLATLAISGKKDLALQKKVSTPELVKTLYEASPQVVKDLVEVNQKGFVKTFLKKFQKVMALKDKKQTPEEKQAGIDTFVVGINGLLNFLYVSSFAAFTMPTMGLDNLFNPDPDYDYDAIAAEEELAEGSFEGSQEAAFNPIASFIPAGFQQGQQNDLRGVGQASFHNQNNIIPQEYSSYSHYSGQKMSLPQTPNHIAVDNQVHHNWDQPKYHKFKMYNPHN